MSWTPLFNRRTFLKGALRSHAWIQGHYQKQRSLGHLKPLTEYAEEPLVPPLKQAEVSKELILDEPQLKPRQPIRYYTPYYDSQQLQNRHLGKAIRTIQKL